jgi:hypothetical protein
MRRKGRRGDGIRKKGDRGPERGILSGRPVRKNGLKETVKVSGKKGRRLPMRMKGRRLKGESSQWDW